MRLLNSPNLLRRCLMYQNHSVPIRTLFRELSTQASDLNDFPSGRASNEYMEAMYDAWTKDPNSVHTSWNAYFRTGQYSRPPSNLDGVKAQAPPPSGDQDGQPLRDFRLSALPDNGKMSPNFMMQYKMDSKGQVSYYPQLDQFGIDRQIILKNIAVHLFVRSFQMRGHRWAKIDPLNISQVDVDPRKVFDLSMQLYGLEENDMDKKFMLPASSFIGGNNIELPLRDIIQRLEEVYCSSIGLQFMYINNYEQCIWLRQQFEAPDAMKLSAETRWTALKRLVRASLLERYLNIKWPTEKRFGLEGGESVIASIKTIIDEANKRGVNTFIIGMAHRGRINILANVTRKPLSDIFSRFNPSLEPTGHGSGDVKYHLGTITDRYNRQSDKDTTIILAANPSHLEAVDPIVEGKCKARQFFANDTTGHNTMAILIHGDAAFAGEGIVYETMNLSDLPMYTTHGTVHIVINNQIGFTTDPLMARSSPYCTDVARVVNAPIFHVNGDDLDALVHVSTVAAMWRQRFKKDVVLDVVGYRRHGHNEMDDPSFTHPIMYKAIAKQVPTMEKYAEKLIAEDVIQSSEFEDYVKKYQKILDDGFQLSKTHKHDVDWIDSKWSSFDKSVTTEPHTGIEMSVLDLIADKYAAVPEGIDVHKGLTRILHNRQTMLKNGKMDWAIGEALAIGSILMENKHVRLSGEDCERGTFSHRHHVLHDQNIHKKTYTPLDNLSETQGKYVVCNSNLCEYGVLGFELGYSTENANSLVIWEAQFGDFANNAQCIIDQFISSGEAKWNRQTGLVMLLPHAFEGSGPEHSSARIERFMALCNEDWYSVPRVDADKDFSLERLRQTNMILANCTTPANFFHVLRRQLALPFRKPLVVFTPKSLLRSNDVVSTLQEVATGTQFRRIIRDPFDTNKSDGKENVKRLIFCSGHVYYDLKKKVNESGVADNVHIVRIEQLCPFPTDLVRECLLDFPKAEVCWLQEEHKNMGPFMGCSEAIKALLMEIHQKNTIEDIRYIGRPCAAAVATGNLVQHTNELNELLGQAVNLA